MDISFALPRRALRQVVRSIIFDAPELSSASLGPNVPKTSTWARVPAPIGRNGKSGSFDVDFIDLSLLDVQLNFRGQVQKLGSRNSSSETIHDYIERKIAARELVPDRVSFVGVTTVREWGPTVLTERSPGNSRT